MSNINNDEDYFQSTQKDNELDSVLELSDDDTNEHLASRIYNSEFAAIDQINVDQDGLTQHDSNNSISEDLESSYNNDEDNSKIVKKYRKHLPIEIKGIMYSKQKYEQLIKSIEYDFKTNLTLHLYSSYLTRINNNLEFPSQYWYAWPLNTSQVPDPKSDQLYADFIQIKNVKHVFERVAQNKGALQNSTVEMSDPTSELRYEFDNLYKKILFRQRKCIIPDSLPYESMDRFIDKFDELIEKIIMNQIPFTPEKKTSIFLQQMTQRPKKRSRKSHLLDWTDILALAASNDSIHANLRINYFKIFKQCEKLFIDHARKYIKPEFKLQKYQRNSKARKIFKRALKRIERKRVLSQRIIRRKQSKAVVYSTSNSSKRYRKNIKICENKTNLRDDDIIDVYLIK